MTRDTARNIIVSITSHPGRMRSLGQMLYMFFRMQTVLPEKVILSLSEDEYPSGLASLPNDIRLIVSSFPVELKLIPGNIMVHKRHVLIEECPERDYLILDDDFVYPADVIANCVKWKAEHPDAIATVDSGWAYTYDFHGSGYELKWLHTPDISTHHALFGQSFFPSGTFPLETIDYRSVRDAVSPHCDECWLNPFVVHRGTPIGALKSIGVPLAIEGSQSVSLCGVMFTRDANGLYRKSNILNDVLLSLPGDYMDAWVNAYPAYVKPMSLWNMR